MQRIEGGLCALGLDDDHDIEMITEALLLAPKDLAKTPFPSIASHCVADSFTHRHSQPGVVEIVGHSVDHDPPSTGASSAPPGV